MFLTFLIQDIRVELPFFGPFPIEQIIDLLRSQLVLKIYMSKE